MKGRLEKVPITKGWGQEREKREGGTNVKIQRFDIAPTRTKAKEKNDRFLAFSFLFCWPRLAVVPFRYQRVTFGGEIVSQNNRKKRGSTA